MMEDQIGTAITAAVGDLLPFYLSEAEEDNYPYGVYYYSPEYFSTKDGVYKIAADVTVQVYSNNFNQAWVKAGEIFSAIKKSMNSGKFFTSISTTSKECVEGVWNIETVYRIIQIS